jgi:hypothetical protein
MKKNILFSIALCVGLMLPTASFGSESSQTVWSRIASYFSGYKPQWPNLSEWATSFVNKLSDNQKYALYTALTVALGYTGYQYLKTGKSIDKEGILEGALGSAYATKLKDILNYNDARSIEAGLITLARAITTDIDNINKEDTPRATKITDLKRRIDAVHAKMLQRRALD